MYKEIFFCENNVSKGLDEVIERLDREYPDATIYIENCLAHCGTCAETYYAEIDAEIITADEPDELYEKIRTKIEEES